MQIDSISNETAAKIVSTLKDTIQHDITFMDTNGVIIACTNPDRVGMVHGGAVAMLEHSLETLVVSDDTVYPGTRCGINMRLTFYDKTVGIVGITGNPDEVERYGNVIRRMTELMLLQEEHNRKMLQRRFDIDRFLHKWIQETSPLDEEFLLSGLRLGIDISIMRRVVVAVLDPYASREQRGTLNSDLSIRHSLKQILPGLLGDDFQNLWYFDGSTLVLLLREEKEEALFGFLHTIQAKALETAGVSLRFGCDNVASSKWDVRDGYLRAMQALRDSRSRELVTIYKDLGISQMLRYVPKEVRQKYLYKLFPGQTPQQIREWCQLIDAVLENNGSINAIAEHMFVHKNTVQYRIRKLESITGFDCRVSRDIPALYVAKILWEQQNEEFIDLE